MKHVKPFILAVGFREEALISMRTECRIHLVSESWEDLGKADVRMDTVPSGVSCILIGCDIDHRSECSRLIQRWQDVHRIDVPILFYSDENFRGFITILKENLERSITATALMREAAEMRRIHEELHNSYSKIREFIYREGLSTPKISFQNNHTEISSQPEARSFEQNLPIDMQRITALSLYISKPASNHAEGNLLISLAAIGRETGEHRWKLPFHNISSGWNTFVIGDRKISHIAKDALLNITIETVASEDEGLSFALGDEVLHPRMAVSIDGKVQARALALRCWTGLPGVRPAITGAMWPVFLQGEQRLDRLEMIPEGSVAVSSLVIPEAMDFEAIKWDADRRWILVHPLSTHPTIAKLNNAIPYGTRQVVVEFETVHADAGTVEYSIAVDNDDEINPDTLEWISVPAKSPGILKIDVEYNARSRDLLLLTRLPKGESSSFCWAHFQRIYVDGDFR